MGLKIHRDERIIEQLSHEIAILKRHKYAKRSEQISLAQGSLLDDLLNTDLETIDAELKALRPALTPDKPRQQPERAPLPAQFPRTVIRHEPESTQCACGCQLQRLGKDVSEKLDYTPTLHTKAREPRRWSWFTSESILRRALPNIALLFPPSEMRTPSGACGETLNECPLATPTPSLLKA